jgi:hypothetical protein
MRYDLAPEFMMQLCPMLGRVDTCFTRGSGEYHGKSTSSFEHAWISVLGS